MCWKKPPVVCLTTFGSSPPLLNKAEKDILLRQKPQDRLPDGNINVKLLLQTDSNSRATISIAEVNGKYSDGALVNKEDLEIRIRTSSEDLFWLDSGKI